MNKIDKKLHSEIHKFMMGQHPNKIFTPRVNLFNKLEKSLNIEMHGDVLDIGCGNGYASIWLAKNKHIKRVYALEASKLAVKELLPRNIQYHGVQEKVFPLLGTFENIKLKNLNYVVSFGALHHSKCLYTTFKSVSNSLKNGGYVIAQEPTMSNFTSNLQYLEKYDTKEERFGIKIKNGDRVDRFYREAEYITAASFCGLDLVYYDDYYSVQGLSFKMRYFLSKNFKNMNKPFFVNRQQDHLKSTKNIPLSKVMVFRKSQVKPIPHVWQPLIKDENM